MKIIENHEKSYNKIKNGNHLKYVKQASLDSKIQHIYEEVEDLDEGNIVKTGRVQRIKRRIRRNKQGRIILQRNVRRSAIKGYRLSGNTVKRIPAAQRLHKSRMLKRYWKTKGRSKMNRVLLKRKMSMRRRKSMGIK